MIAKCLVSGPSMQGVSFRETVAREADKEGLKGKAKNMPDGDVELLFIYDKKADEEPIKQCIKNALEKMAEAGLVEVDEIEAIKINDAEKDSFDLRPVSDSDTENRLRHKKRFVIEREHELKETVWALQGAGKVFLSASKKVEAMLGYKERELIGRLISVQKELLYIQNHPGDVKEPVCLKQFIVDPLIDLEAKPGEPDLIRDLIEFYHDYVTVREKGTGMDNGEMVNRIDKLNDGIKRVIEKLNNAKRQKDKQAK
jgi:acylphosphatase